MRMKEKLKLKKASDRKKIASYLSTGKIGLFPTDTVWGICCRMDDPASVERVFEIKNREKNKPFLILVESISQIEKYANMDDSAKIIAKKYWPGALTVVLNSKEENVLPIVRASGNTVAVRIPDYDEIRKIISIVGAPLIAPSANLSGEKPPEDLNEVDERIIKAVDFIVVGECKIKQPSTIIDLTHNKPKIIREGAVKFTI